MLEVDYFSFSGVHCIFSLSVIGNEEILLLSDLVGDLYRQTDIIRTNRLNLQLKYNFRDKFLFPRIYTSQLYSRNSIVKNVLEFSWKEHYRNFSDCMLSNILESLFTLHIP